MFQHSQMPRFPSVPSRRKKCFFSPMSVFFTFAFVRMILSRADFQEGVYGFWRICSSIIDHPTCSGFSSHLTHASFCFAEEHPCPQRPCGYPWPLFSSFQEDWGPFLDCFFRGKSEPTGSPQPSYFFLLNLLWSFLSIRLLLLVQHFTPCFQLSTLFFPNASPVEINFFSPSGACLDGVPQRGTQLQPGWPPSPLLPGNGCFPTAAKLFFFLRPVPAKPLVQINLFSSQCDHPFLLPPFKKSLKPIPFLLRSLPLTKMLLFYCSFSGLVETSVPVTLLLNRHLSLSIVTVVPPPPQQKLSFPPPPTFSSLKPLLWRSSIS